MTEFNLPKNRVKKSIKMGGREYRHFHRSGDDKLTFLLLFMANCLLLPNEGKVRSHLEEGQINEAGCLNLVVNAIYGIRCICRQPSSNCGRKGIKSMTMT